MAYIVTHSGHINIVQVDWKHDKQNISLPRKRIWSHFQQKLQKDGSIKTGFGARWQWLEEKGYHYDKMAFLSSNPQTTLGIAETGRAERVLCVKGLKRHKVPLHFTLIHH